ncbi:MAG: GNAT family N-acetyltransferase [Planctomycetes bacterium]|nr:GNAT family N-acetyltransferase [Planctomycetota bacterium]
MADLVIKEFQKSDLPKIVDFWNTNFKGRRNFWRITKKTFIKRIVLKKSSVAVFDPHTYLVALLDDKMIGILHYGVFDKQALKILFNREDSLGFIAFLFVSPKHRRIGVGKHLMDQALKDFSNMGIKKTIIDGQCLNPFYGNAEDMEQPFFDTPEGVSIPSVDMETYNFFYKYGFMPRYRGITLSAQVKDIKIDKFKAENGFELGIKNTVGMVVVNLLKSKKILGVLDALQMKQSDKKKWGIHTLEIADECRGKGFGKYLLGKLVETLKKKKAKTIECISIRELSSEAINFYQHYGFKKECEWFIY